MQTTAIYSRICMLLISIISYYRETIDKLNRHKEGLEQKLQQLKLDKR